MREPVTTECQHNFCHSCLRQYCKDPQKRFPCPLCQHPCQGWDLSLNNPLAKITKLIQLLLLYNNSKELKQPEERLCERHNQRLSLFCGKHMQLLCPGCVEPPHHQCHPLRSVAEAASRYRQKVNVLIRPFMKYVRKLQDCESMQDRKLQDMRKEVANERLKLASKVFHKQGFMNTEHTAALSRLARQKKIIQHKYKTNRIAFQDYIYTTEALFKEVAEKSMMPDLNMLNEAKMIHHRCESLEPPAVCSFQLRREGYTLPPMDSTLEKIQQKFRAEVTLDPHTAHPHLCVSKDKRSVTPRETRSTVLQRQLTNLFDLEVLGSQEFHAGRHYWEVQVNDKPSWAIGLYSHSPSSRGQQQPRSGKNRRWFIHLQDGDYLAVGARPVLLALGENPRRIGVYLDWELGQISFYNLNDNSHLHSFQETFSHSLKPYFCVGPDLIPLSLCAVRG
ncbi:tripartite motif-containing protein 75-like [Erinaceus europaeus]|uniref:Tripartite motif-containing protein 75-like n=1 Tax=Erinaceus europaeus TaxID=9365 RepID=A0ABM3WEY9_ERIEU|nr:tripartite motif-containing protein 75-like [Erinaceus europaeus]